MNCKTVVPHFLLSLLLPGILQAAILSPELAQISASSPPNEFLPVALILREQVSFQDLYPRVRNLPKAERRARVISALRDLADGTQGRLRADLDALTRTGKARSVRPLWIRNAIALEIQAGELDRLAREYPELAQLRWDPPRPLAEVLDVFAADRRSAALPDETDVISWGVLDIQAPQVWNLGYRGQGVVIGNLDTGTDYNHPDLADHIWVNPGEDLNGNGIVDPSDWNGVDDDQNGYVDDLRGWAFDTHCSEVMDYSGHGTSTAGIVVGDGAGGNATGVAPQAKLMILKNSSGGESMYWEAQQYAIANGADVITSSLSYKWRYIPRPDYATMRHNTEMELAAGVIHSNSIGNEGDNLNTDPLPFNISTPGNCPAPWFHPDQLLHGGLASILGTGAYGANHQIKDYSSIGPAAWLLRDILQLDPNYPWQANWPEEYNDYPYQNAQFQALIKPDLAAPTDVTTTAMGGGYVTGFNGTSAATPHIGGTLCLLLSADPEATPELLAQILMSTAVDMGPAGKDNRWGAGQVNAYAAVTALLSSISATLTGVVTDGNTGSPLNGADVDLPDLQIWTQTDSLGSYILPGIPPGLHDVRFTASGFDTLVIADLEFSVGVVETLSVSLSGPRIQVDPDSITAGLHEGETLQIPLTVRNTGSADLVVSFSKRGDWTPNSLYAMIQAQAATSDDKLFGVEIAAGSIWVTGGNGNQEPNYLYRFSFEGALLDTLVQPASASTWGWRDLAWDGQYLYGSSGTEIQGVDLNGNLQAVIPGPLPLHRALAYDPAEDHFYSCDNTTEIVELGRDGNPVRSWTHDLHIQGFAWHPQDEDGYPLYIFSQDGTGALLRVSKMNPDDGDIVFVMNLIGLSGDQAGGAAISGDIDPDRWCFAGLIQAGSISLDRVQINSLGAYAPWITIEPLAQTIPPGGTLNATAFLNAGVVPVGDYAIRLVIQHNAPQPEFVLPATLTVQPTAVADFPGASAPATFRAGPVFPNPCNAQMTLPVELPQPARLIVTLFDLQGRRVAEVFNGTKSAGSHRFIWDAAGLPSGIYFYRAAGSAIPDGASFTSAGKILLLK
jgi:subtilisin family serine protease